MKKAWKMNLAALLALTLTLAGLLPAAAGERRAGGLARAGAFRQLHSIIDGGRAPYSFVPAGRVYLEAAPEPGEGEPVLPQMEPGLTEEDLGKIYAIAAIIYNGHVDPVERRKLYYGAVKGMARELDPHSQFFTPEEFERFKNDLQGSFAGIGAGMGRKEDGKPQPLQYVIPGSPAERAGLKGGDVILEINSAPTGPMTGEDITSKLRGRPGTTVNLKIGRPDPATRKPSTFDVTITRAVIQTANAYSKMLAGGAGYVYFNEFRQDSDKTVLGHVRKLVGQGARSVIIDVRFNPGGSMEAVARLTAAFLKKGQVVFTAKNRQGAANEWKNPSDGEFRDLPVKVLVNGYSASASEIFAGALQDHGRAQVLGARTYGKGTAQSIIPFKDGSALKLTMQRWYTPSGRSIQRDDQGNGGVIPDVAVAVEQDQEIQVISRILKELSGAPQAGAPVADPVLERALGN